MLERFSNLMSLVKPKRRWAQFSLGTMLLAVTVLCVWLADYVSPIRRLERQLGDPDEEKRELAAERLGYLGPEARSTTKSLLGATADTSPSVRVTAVWALSRVSRRADLLAPLLKDSDADVSLAAAEGMLWNGNDPTTLVPTLLRLAGRTSGVHLIFEALGPDDAAVVVPLLLDSLSPIEGTLPRYVRDPAAEALNHIALPAATVVDALVERLGHERPKVRIAAAEQLLRLGESAKAAAPALRARLHDANSNCAATCAAALGAVDPEDNEFLPVLKRALRSDDIELAHRVAWYLLVLGPDADGASDDLVEFLCDSRGFGGWPFSGATNLVRLGPAAVCALDRALRRAMADRDRLPLTPRGLRERVENIAWVALPVVRSVRERVRGESPQSHLARRQRLAKIRLLDRAEEIAAKLAAPNRRSMLPFYLGWFGSTAALATPTLIAALDYADFRHNAVVCLGKIGKGARPGAPRLLRFIESDDVALRDSAFDALEKIGGADEAGRARLHPLLGSTDRHERARAALVLAASGEPAGQILPTLIELAANPHFSRDGEELPMGGTLSSTMGASLAAGIGSLGSAAVPELTLALQDPNPRVRRIAAEALGKVGPAARVAVSDLIELLEDKPSWDAAAKALGRIGPEAHTAAPKLLEALEAMRQPPDLNEYDTDEYDWSEYDSSGYDSDEYLPRLQALGGIGAAAHNPVPEVLRLANFDDPQIRQEAVLTLARIDRANTSLIPHMRRLLAEWERKPATEDVRAVWVGSHPLERVAEVVWELGPRAEPLASNLERIMTADHLVSRKVRLYAALALARFASNRQSAQEYLEHVAKSGLPGSFEYVNLADALLQRINEARTTGTWRVQPYEVNP